MIMDSKPVSLLSTATMRRPLKGQTNKVELPFSKAFAIYNKNMGEVNQHN